jgi:hypothetical protein
MECPHCHEALPSKNCRVCGKDIPEESLYCLYCGASLDETESSYDDDEGGLDLDNRILCPDGTCTGIIENGRCTECGKPYPEGGGDDAEADAEEAGS